MSDGNLNRAVAHATIAMRHDDLKRVFFASAVCFDRIYIHGGCQEPSGKLPRPLNDMLMYDIWYLSGAKSAEVTNYLSIYDTGGS